MKITINHIGSFAAEVLERSEDALVSGIASRGIYLQPEDDWTLYLSLEKFRGPLTLNLAVGSTQLKIIKAGITVQLNPGEIRFADEEVTISFADSQIWHPPPVDTRKKLHPESLDTMLALVNKVSPENPYLPLLSRNPEKIPGVPAIGERIHNFRNSLASGDGERIAEGAIKLLGLGPGLTPLGDDFLLGVLLALNRWGHLFSADLLEDQDHKPGSFPPTLINDINQIILENTHLKTTKISAALLACAAQGAADERLLVILDRLYSGSMVTQNEMRNLLRWGNSSGITVLAGMIALLNL